MRYPGEEIKYLKKEVENWQELTDRWKHIAEEVIKDLEYHRAAQTQIREALEELDYLK